MIGRLFRHWFHGRWTLRGTLPPAALARIEAAIADAERGHSGEICFAVEPALPLPVVWSRVSPRARAVAVFSQLRVWDTEQNSGVLIYLLLADRDVEIVADRGIHRRVGEATWEAVCKRMEGHFRSGRFEEGVIAGISEVGALLRSHFPAGPGDVDELPDKPVVLG